MLGGGGDGFLDIVVFFGFREILVSVSGWGAELHEVASFFWRRFRFRESDAVWIWSEVSGVSIAAT